MVASSSLKLQFSSFNLRCKVLSLIFSFLAICDSEGVPLGNNAISWSFTKAIRFCCPYDARRLDSSS